MSLKADFIFTTQLAPASARLGRRHRVIGKFFEDRALNRGRAEAAFKRAPWS